MNMTRFRMFLVQLWQTLLPILPTKAVLLRWLPLLVIGTLVGLDQAYAQASVDSLGGSKVGSQLCSFGNSVENSVLGKGICVAVIGWGLIRWLPNRRDGIPEMIGGVVAFIVVTKVKAIMALFGVSC